MVRTAVQVAAFESWLDTEVRTRSAYARQWEEQPDWWKECFLAAVSTAYNMGLKHNV